MRFLDWRMILNKNLTMIERVVQAAKQTNYDVYVATDTQEIASLAELQGAISVITDESCASGTDRVFRAMQILSLQHEVIVNLQGDMPFIEPSVIASVANMAASTSYDITTAVAKTDAIYAQSPSNVKAVIDTDGRALYFSRALIPYDSSTYLCHVGIYAFKRNVLEKFCHLPQCDLEKLENLEQLRALYNQISIGTCQINNMPISVDTPDDLQSARDYFLKHLS